MTTRLPPAIAALVRGRAPQLMTAGESGARVTRFTRAGERALFLKTAAATSESSTRAAATVDSPGDEANRLRWLAMQRVPVPAVRAYVAREGHEYLLTDGIAGTDASVVAARLTARSDAAETDAQALVHALADALRNLHAFPATDCPFRHPARERVAQARERARRGLVDERDFDEERLGRSPADLLAELESLLPHDEGAVLTHGDYCLPNVMIATVPSSERAQHRDGVAVAGFIDCARAGLADPYQDLALGARSIAFNLGARWAGPFLERYGVGVVDERKMRFYTLLDEFF